MQCILCRSSQNRNFQLFSRFRLQTSLLYWTSQIIWNSQKFYKIICNQQFKDYSSVKIWQLMPNRTNEVNQKSTRINENQRESIKKSIKNLQQSKNLINHQLLHQEQDKLVSVAVIWQPFATQVVLRGVLGPCQWLWDAEWCLCLIIHCDRLINSWLSNPRYFLFQITL